MTVSIAVPHDGEVEPCSTFPSPSQTPSHVAPPHFTNCPIALLEKNQFFKDFTKLNWPLWCVAQIKVTKIISKPISSRKQRMARLYDAEIFLEEVRQHDFLYNKGNPNFKDVERKRNRWGLIGEMFGISGKRMCVLIVFSLCQGVVQ